MINIPGNTGNVGKSALCLIVQGNGPGGMVLSLSFPAVRTFLVNYDLTNCSGYANIVYMSTRKREMETLKITKTFLWDHESRGLPMPNIVKETKQYAWIEINWTHAGYVDLYEDAEYYGWEMGAGGYEDTGTIRSARSLYYKMQETLVHESFERMGSSDWFQDWFKEVERKAYGWNMAKPKPKTEVPTMESLMSKEIDTLRTICKPMGIRPSDNASKQEIAELILETAN